MYYICEKIIIILRWKSRWQKWISGSFKNRSPSDKIDSFRIELTISEGSVILSHDFTAFKKNVNVFVNKKILLCVYTFCDCCNVQSFLSTLALEFKYYVDIWWRIIVLHGKTRYSGVDNGIKKPVFGWSSSLCKIRRPRLFATAERRNRRAPFLFW